MKRFLVFTVLFSPLALLVYVAPLVIHEGFPKLDFLIFLMGFAYVLAVVPGWVAAGVDWMLAAKPFYVRVIATMAVAAAMGQWVAWYLGNPMNSSEMITVALTGAIPAAVCSWLSALPFGSTA
jgi:hypothetical protein